MIEKTLVILKPDAVERGLMGEIIKTFEQANLKIRAMKMMTAEADLIDQHYAATDAWLTGVGEKTKSSYADNGGDVLADMGTEDPMEIGKMVKGWLIEYMTSGPILPMIIEGNEAIANVRRLAGFTLPCKAEPGTIRGKFEIDSSYMANKEKRVLRNLMHASGEPDEASSEIKLWFPEFKG